MVSNFDCLMIFTTSLFFNLDRMVRGALSMFDATFTGDLCAWIFHGI